MTATIGVPDFDWPAPAGQAKPRWTGSGFSIGETQVPVLRYGDTDSGWSDGLTDLHENVAGSDHPIDELSRASAIGALRRHLTSPRPVILEVGSSSGFLLPAIRAEWPSALVIGSDFIAGPLERLAAREPHIPLVQFDLTICPLPSESVDAVVMLNVLEHIEDHHAAVGHVARILKPGGIAVVEVPAGPHLFDAYDEFLQHKRRYTARGLADLLHAHSLAIVSASHLGWTVYPGFAFVKRRNQQRAAATPEARQRIVEANIAGTRSSVIMRSLMQIEAALGRIVSVPFGIRAVAVARKAA